jgi:hypothetical protein
MKTRKLLILGLLFLTSCEMDFDDRDHALYMVNEIDYYIGKDLAKNKQLYLIGTGGRAMLGIERNSLDFSYYRDEELKIEEARKDIVEVVSKYLQEINQKKELRPFLRNYPFTLENVEITFFVMTEKAGNVPDGALHVIKAMNGKISYYIAPFTPQRKPILRETFEEAREKVQALANKSE